MIVVIIAGGSGTRLWPLSTPNYPKHLLKVADGDTSLLQQTYERAKLLSNNVYVVTEASHVNHVMQQLPDMPKDNVICEPARRGTANCILAALHRIESSEDPSDIIAFTHADHYVRDLAGFSNSFNLAKYISTQEDKIVLLGVEPSYPSTAFGYIEKGELLKGQPFAYKVKSFKEKPDFETARNYLNTGNYLWNCGYFVGSLDTFREAIKNYAPDLDKNLQALSQTTPETYDATYLNFESAPIDTVLIEKVPELFVVPASFDWMDIGSFNDLSKAIGGDENGNSLKGNVAIVEVENSLIENYEDKPVAVVGLDNIVVINNGQGILVTRKDMSQQVGEISKKLNQ